MSLKLKPEERGKKVIVVSALPHCGLKKMDETCSVRIFVILKVVGSQTEQKWSFDAEKEA